MHGYNIITRSGSFQLKGEATIPPLGRFLVQWDQRGTSLLKGHSLFSILVVTSQQHLDQSVLFFFPNIFNTMLCPCSFVFSVFLPASWCLLDPWIAFPQPPPPTLPSVAPHICITTFAPSLLYKGRVLPLFPFHLDPSCHTYLLSLSSICWLTVASYVSLN